MKNQTFLILGAAVISAAALASDQNLEIVSWSIDSHLTKDGRNFSINIVPKIREPFKIYPLQALAKSPTATTLVVKSEDHFLKLQAFERQSPIAFRIEGRRSEDRGGALDLEIRYSVCSEKICYPPETFSRTIDFTSAPVEANQVAEAFVFVSRGVCVKLSQSLDWLSRLRARAAQFMSLAFSGFYEGVPVQCDV